MFQIMLDCHLFQCVYSDYDWTQHIYNFQGINQASILLQHIHLFNSITIRLLIGYPWHQLFCCSIGFQLLSNPLSPFTHAIDSWLSYLHKFLSISAMLIDFPLTLLSTPCLLCHSDINQTEAFSSLSLKPQKLWLTSEPMSPLPSGQIFGQNMQH
jgi:hypothetical protein